MNTIGEVVQNVAATFTPKYVLEDGTYDYRTAHEDYLRTNEKFRAELMELYGEKYPDIEIPDHACFDYRQMKKENAQCANCTGYPCAKTFGAKGYQGSVVYYRPHKNFTRHYVPCKYHQQQMILAKIKKQFANSKIPQRYIGKTFDDYRVYPGNENAVKWAKYILESPKSLYIYGVPKAGKTMLASIIAQEFAKQGKAVVFGDVPTILFDMRATFDKTKDSEDNINDLMKTLLQAEILVLDDIGTEDVTQWAVQQLYMIINSRYNDDKVTIVTSNYDLNKLAERLNAPKDGKAGITGDRIARRLSEMCGKAFIEKEVIKK